MGIKFDQHVDFFDALVRYETILWNEVDEELRRAGQVSLGQLHALRMIDRHAGTARVQELSAEIGITVGAASKLADRLERDGLTTRRPHPRDRRSSLIALTAAGNRAVKAGSSKMRAVLLQLYDVADAHAGTALLAALQQRLDQFQEAKSA